jgi:hypothetical protein
MKPAGLEESFPKTRLSVNLQAVEGVPIAKLKHLLDTPTAGDGKYPEPLVLARGAIRLAFPSGAGEEG